jgi:hypothetical protein
MNVNGEKHLSSVGPGPQVSKRGTSLPHLPDSVSVCPGHQGYYWCVCLSGSLEVPLVGGLVPVGGGGYKERV